MDPMLDFSVPEQLEEYDSTLEQDDEAGANLRLGSLIFEETFGGGTAFDGQSLQFAGNHSFQVTNDPQNSGNKVGKFELRYNDKHVKSSKRAEVGLRANEREGWYSYSVFFPTSGYSKDQYPEIISQWHQEGGGSPPNAVQIENDEIYLRSIKRSDTNDNSNAAYNNYRLGKVERGKWNDFVFHIIHSPNSDGLIEIWHNKVKVHTIKGPTMRRNFSVPSLKIGIYKWTWTKQKTNTDRRVVYFDNVKVGNKNASLEDFLSGAIKSVGNAVDEKNNGGQTSSGSAIITGFNLIQANTDKDLGPIKYGEAVNTPTHKMSIRANTSSSFRGEIRFKLSGARNHTYIDSSAPFALFGDNGRGDYFFGGGLSRGSYTLEATPYSGNSKAGETAVIKFTVKK